MSSSIELLAAIADVMYGVEEGAEQHSRSASFARAIDIEPFIDELERAAVDDGVERCGEDSFCLGAAVLLYAIEPLLTPEGQGLADVAVRQMRSHGAAIERVEQPHEHVLSIVGSTQEGWLEARVFAARGWVFLISAPTEHDATGLVDLLDRQIADIEGDSAG